MREIDCGQCGGHGEQVDYSKDDGSKVFGVHYVCDRCGGTGYMLMDHGFGPKPISEATLRAEQDTETRAAR